MAGVLHRNEGSDLEQPVLPKRVRVPARVAALRNEREGESSASSSENLTPHSQCGETPTFGRNELFRLTSVRRALTNTDLWESLPSSSKAFLVLSCAATVVILAFCTQQLISGPELLHVVLAMLVTAVFFLMLVIDAILHENAFELLASAVLALCVAARVLYFAVTKHHPRGVLAVCVLLIILLFGDVCLAVATYSQFGWRVYSKIACDPRAKDAKDRRRTHMIVSIFTTLLKLDTQLLLILFVIGVSTGARSTAEIPRNQPLLIVNPVGLVLCLVWLGFTFFTVRDEVVALELPLVIALPFCYVMPIADIILAFNKEHPTVTNARTSVTLSAVLFIAVRSLVFLFMQACIARFKQMHAHNQRAHSEIKADRHGIPEDIPKELVPLMKGAWVGKPATTAKRKRRFFQLSTDGSTLRWAWDKYILMYYVEEQINNNSDLNITLKMAMEADLHLKFFSSSQYTVWKEGFAMLLRLLNSPSSLTRDGSGSAQASLFSVDSTFQRSLSQNSGLMQQILSETKVPGGFSVKMILRKMGFSTAHRPSILDPNNKRLHEAANKVRALRKMGISVLTGNATVTAQVSIGGGTAAKVDANHKRNLTIPSIEEFVEIMKKSNKQGMQDQSPRRQEEGLQRASSSFLAKGKELVITALSPNTRRPRVRVRNQGSPTSTRSAARVLFSERPPTGESSQGASAAGVLKRSASVGATATPRRTKSGFSWFRDTEVAGPSKAAQSKAGPSGGAPELMRASTLDLRHLSPNASAELKRTASGSEAVDSRECLDTVGPLPGDSRGSTPDPSPSKPQISQAATLLPVQKPKESQDRHTEIQVVVHSPGQEGTGDERLDAAKRSGGDASSTTIFQPSWKIQRTRTASGSGSILGGASPRTLRTDFSGAFTSDSSSSNWGGTAGSHSNTSSISSFNSLGPPGGIQIAIQFIEYEDLTFGRCLGSGSEGSVYGAWYQETPVAVKQTTSQGEVEMNLHAGSHDNVVALRGLSQSDNQLFLVMEYCPKGTLDLLIHGQAPAQWDPARLVQPVRSIARGMLHLHTRKPPILHRDLKPANIFVGHGMLMKVGDFGMSRHILMNRDGQGQYRLERQLTRSTIGTAAYCAPELMEDDELPRYSVQNMSVDRADRILKSDVYSFGVTVWEILTRRRPHADMNSFQISYAWSNGEDMSLPPVVMPDNLGQQGRLVMRCLSELVTDCTQLDPDKRPSFHEILSRLKPLTSSSLGTATPAWVSPKAPRGSGLASSGSVRLG